MNTPILILEASKQAYLNIGVSAGGMKCNGTEYIYLRQYDAFLKKDYLSKYNRLMKNGTTWDGFVKLIKDKQIDLIKIDTPKKEVKEDTNKTQISLF